MPRSGILAASVLALLACLWPGAAGAQLPELPRSLVTAALGEPRPFVFHAADFTSADFVLDRVGGDAAVEVALDPDSLRWVRVSRVLVPRAVLRVRAVGADSGVVRYAGFTHPLVQQRGRVLGELPVVLLSHPGYPIEVELRQGATLHSATFRLRFAPRASQRGRVMFDASCSRFGLRVRNGAPPVDSFVYVGCRLVQTDLAGHLAPTLELYVLWDHVGSQIEIEGVPTTAAGDALFACRVASPPGAVHLEAGGKRLTLEYHLPVRLHAGFLGVGLGAYAYWLRDGRVDLRAGVPLLTLYAGYAFTPTARIVYFNATALDRFGYIDQGLYLWLEQFRLLDRRLSLNLLLGGNLLLYRRQGVVAGRLSAPQGLELVFHDFLARNRNLTSGAFVYPKIFGRSYYDLWLRWGSPRLFAEVNFIDWREPHGDTPSHGRSLGLSLGGALLTFL